MSTRNKLLWSIGILAVAGGALAYGVPVQYVLIAGVLLLCPAMMFMHFSKPSVATLGRC